MRIVLISDTHGSHRRLKVPDGDVLIHGGDLTRTGRIEEVQAFAEWMGDHPHRHKIAIAGNHDFCFETHAEESRALIETVATYLEDELVAIDGVRFFGSPWTPRFMSWAFQRERGDEIAAVWEAIPDDVDVLITHGPPFGIRDRTFLGMHVGCEALRTAVERVQPTLHVFGHIHEAAGEAMLGDTRCVNASSVLMRALPMRRPRVVDL